MGSEDQQRKAKQELQLLMIALHGTLRYQLRARNRTARANLIQSRVTKRWLHPR